MLVTQLELTQRQQAIFAFIVRYIRSSGIPPTIREIGAAFRIGPNGVVGHLRSLARKRYIVLVSGSARGIRLAAPFRCPCCDTGVDPALVLNN